MGRFGLGCGLRRRAEAGERRDAAGDDCQAAVKRKPLAFREHAGFAERFLQTEPSPSRGFGGPEVGQLIDDIGDARDNAVHALHALTRLRTALCSSTAPCIQDVIDAGGLPVLVERLRDTSPFLQFEAAWILTNMAAGTSDQTAAIVGAGVVEAVLNIVTSPAVADRPELCDQCLWLLANIVGDDNIKHRDWVLLEAEGIGQLGRLYHQIPGFPWSFHSRIQVTRSLTWLLSALCHGKPAPPIAEVDCLFEYFAQAVVISDDAPTLTEAAWGLCHLLEGASNDQDTLSRAARMMSVSFAAEELPQPARSQYPLLEKLVWCATPEGQQATPQQVPALRVLGVLVCVQEGNFCEMAVAAGALKVLGGVLVQQQAPAQMKCDAAWALSNLAAGTPRQVQCLFRSPEAVAALCSALEASPGKSLAHECTWALANLAQCGAEVPKNLDCRRILRLLMSALAAGPEAELESAVLAAGRALLSRDDGLIPVAKQCGLMERLRAGGNDDDDTSDQENRPPQSKTAKDCKGMQPPSFNQCSRLQPARFKLAA